MACTIRGTPYPLSTQFSVRVFTRSRNGLAKKASGSTAGKFGVVNPMIGSLSVI